MPHRQAWHDVGVVTKDTSAQRAEPGNVEPVPGRRERKKLETRTALEQAALRLFARQGYERTTVEEIADAADVAVRTFFRYFQSKQHVLYGDAAHGIADRLRVALHDQPAGKAPVTAVGAAMDDLDLAGAEQQRQVLERIRLMEKLPELTGMYHMIFDELHAVCAGFVAERTGQGSHELYPQLVASAATGAVKSAMFAFHASGGVGDSLNDLRRRAYAALSAGLATDPSGKPVSTGRRSAHPGG